MMKKRIRVLKNETVRPLIVYLMQSGQPTVDLVSTGSNESWL